MNKLFFTFALVLCLGFPAFSQSEQIVPIKCVLYVKRSSPASLIVSGRIVNVSNRDVVIDKNGLFNEVLFERRGKLNGNRYSPGRRLQSWSSGTAGKAKPDFMVLAPKKSYTREFTILLSPYPDFFQAGEEYFISVIYRQTENAGITNLAAWKGGVSSNKLAFKLNEDSQLPKKK